MSIFQQMSGQPQPPQGEQGMSPFAQILMALQGNRQRQQEQAAPAPQPMPEAPPANAMQMSPEQAVAAMVQQQNAGMINPPQQQQQKKGGVFSALLKMFAGGG